MAVELAGINLEHLTKLSVSEEARIIRYPIPGMSGDFMQNLGRPSVVVTFWGIFYGDDASANLNQLRAAYLAREPVDFFTEAVGQGYFTQVLIANLDVVQRAGYPNQFDFTCRILEYVKPPEPATSDILASLDSKLVDEATAYIDDVQNTLAQVSQVTALLASLQGFTFANPVKQLPDMLNDYNSAAGSATDILDRVRDLF